MARELENKLQCSLQATAEVNRQADDVIPQCDTLKIAMQKRDELFQSRIDQNIRRIQQRLSPLKIVGSSSGNPPHTETQNASHSNTSGSINKATATQNSRSMRNCDVTLNNKQRNYLVVKKLDGSVLYKPVLIVSHDSTVQMPSHRRGIPVCKLTPPPFYNTESSFYSPVGIEPKPVDLRILHQPVVRNVQYVSSPGAVAWKGYDGSRKNRGSVAQSRKSFQSVTSSVVSALLCWKCLNLDGALEDSDGSDESDSGSDGGGDSGGDDADDDDEYDDCGDVSDIDEIEYSSGGGDSDGSSMSKANSLYQDDIMQNDMRMAEECDDEIAVDPNLTNYTCWDEEYSNIDDYDRRARECYGGYSPFLEDVTDPRVKEDQLSSCNEYEPTNQQ